MKKYVDLLQKIEKIGENEYKIVLNEREIKVLRVALKTQDVINDVLDDELGLV